MALATKSRFIEVGLALGVLYLVVRAQRQLSSVGLSLTNLLPGFTPDATVTPATNTQQPFAPTGNAAPTDTPLPPLTNPDGSSTTTPQLSGPAPTITDGQSFLDYANTHQQDPNGPSIDPSTLPFGQLLPL